jgi:hypothetical protein
MPTEIWDTNAFRNIGKGDLPADGGKAAGANVCYSPVSVLELASKYTEGSFEHRRAAAQAICDSAATLLPDPELYLTGVFGLLLYSASDDRVVITSEAKWQEMAAGAWMGQRVVVRPCGVDGRPSCVKTDC